MKDWGAEVHYSGLIKSGLRDRQVSPLVTWSWLHLAGDEDRDLPRL